MHGVSMYAVLIALPLENNTQSSCFSIILWNDKWFEPSWTSTQIFKTSVNLTNNSPSWDFPYPTKPLYSVNKEMHA